MALLGTVVFSAVAFVPGLATASVVAAAVTAGATVFVAWALRPQPVRAQLRATSRM